MIVATQSIFRNIVIQDSETAESFIEALENAAAAASETKPSRVSSRDLSKDEIRKFFGAFNNA